jgi:hypothetical protein
MIMTEGSDRVSELNPMRHPLRQMRVPAHVEPLQRPSPLLLAFDCPPSLMPPAGNSSLTRAHALFPPLVSCFCTSENFHLIT